MNTNSSHNDHQEDNVQTAGTQLTPADGSLGGENPYAAPTEKSDDDPHLAADVEFLVGELVLLCRDTVELPPVCIATGGQTDLKKVTIDLVYRPRYLTAVAFVATLVYLTNIFLRGFNGNQAELVFMLLMGVPSTILWGLRWMMSKSMSAVYWVSLKAIEDARQRATGYRVLVGLSVAALSITGIAGFYFNSAVFAFVPLLVVFISILLTRCSTRVRPYFYGVHRSLNMLGGFHADFLKEVRQMAENSPDVHCRW